MGTGSRRCQLSAQACVLLDTVGQGRLGGSELIQYTEEKEKETGLKAGFLLREEAHTRAVWLTALVLLSP